MITLDLPRAPSVNALYRNPTAAEKAAAIARGHQGAGRFKTKRYKGWLNAAGWEIKAALANAPVRAITGPVEIHIVAGLPDDGRKHDGDNLAKPVLDLLVEHGIIEDDRWQIARRTIIEAIEGDRLRVCVKPWRAA